ncbi:MAG: MFS transporter [Bacteroidaceae bacterium]|jgi:MFS family permease
MPKDRLFSTDYFFILISNFLFFFAFYLILPIFAMFLMEDFGVASASAGAILSCYTVASLFMRAFSGYLVDSFPRKPLYLFGFVVFTLIFLGYAWAGALLFIILLRILHGLAFGLVSVGGNTIVIDITPSSRRGEAIGYYGLMNNFALCLGPMIGLFLHSAGWGYQSIFYFSLLSGALGIIMASFVHTPYKPPLKRDPISLDRFILIRGLPCSLSLLLLAMPYGMTTTYVALYAQQLGIHVSTGLFFSFMAVGLGISRFSSGKQADRGRGLHVIQLGMILAIVVFILLASVQTLMGWQSRVAEILFFGSALFMGISYGTMFPAFNTLFVNLAPNSRRGTATSTYLTSWDVGIALGLLVGGWINDVTTFDHAYMLGTVVCIISALYFHFKVAPLYERYKLR